MYEVMDDGAARVHSWPQSHPFVACPPQWRIRGWQWRDLQQEDKPGRRMYCHVFVDVSVFELAYTYTMCIWVYFLITIKQWSDTGINYDLWNIHWIGIQKFRIYFAGWNEEVYCYVVFMISKIGKLFCRLCLLGLNFFLYMYYSYNFFLYLTFLKKVKTDLQPTYFETHTVKF